MAFMPFLTAGDPDMETTCRLIRELANRGVDLIEIGFPYSDPIADGPVIQASYQRALNRDLRIAEIFRGIRSLTSDDSVPLTVPLLAMVSFAIIFRIGETAFLEQAREAGFSGLIVPDLPGDEAAEFAALVKSAELDLIQLVSPTTPRERIGRILKSCSGFVYCVSVAGTTGVRTELPDELQNQLRELRTMTDLPLAVGFGISRPEQLDVLRGLADGVIVGSAIVRQLEQLSGDAATDGKTISAIGDYIDEMTTSAHQTRPL